jgi:DNA-binding transcriptional LysR family regulator
LRQTVQTIEHLSDPEAGSVRIGCSPLLAASFVAAVIDRICRCYPRIEFNLVAAPVETVHSELIERKLDILVTRRVGPIVDDRLTFEHLFDDSLVVLAGPLHPWARRRKIELRDAAGQRWVLPPRGYLLGADILHAFESCDVDYPHSAVVTTAPDVRLSLAATGQFLTIFPASALKFGPRYPGLKVLPVTLPLPGVPNGIVSLKNRPLSPAARLFCRHARDVARQ